MTAVAAVLIGWDIYVATTPVEGDTISELIHEWGTKYWFVLVTIGVFIGHFLWPLRIKDVQENQEG
jgi:hypothetical protein